MDLRRYDERYPIDDQSNFQVPLARLEAMYVNYHREEGKAARPITDFLTYWPQDDAPAEDWGEKLKRRLEQFPRAPDSEEWNGNV